MSGVGALMGVLQVRPGAPPNEALVLRRPVLHGAWLRQWLGGVAVDAVPARVGALFALCGSAQAETSRRALALAAAQPVDVPGLEGPAPLDPAQCLRVATVREHLQRFWLDAAGDAAAYPGLPLALLPASPLPRLLPALSGAQADAALRGATDWIDTAWLGQPGALSATLAAFDAQGLDGLERVWQRLTCDHPDTAGAAWLRAVLARKPSLQGVAVADPQAVMLRPDDGAVLDGLAQQLRSVDDFAQSPHQNNSARECGPWLRLGDAHARQRPLDAWTRWVMRWVDLARLLSSENGAGSGPAWLRSGARRTGDDEALAWTEMARGVLMHWVKLEPAVAGGPRRVRDYRVLAPTEWHVHPGGALARAVSGAGGHNSRQSASEMARSWVAVFDPCVAMELF